VFPRSVKIQGEQRVHLGNSDLYFKRVSSSVIEVYFKTRNYSEIIARLNYNENIELIIEPRPLGFNSEYKCIVYKFREPLTILPKTRSELKLDLPYSLAIITNNTVVSTIEPMKRKIALYGPPTIGDLCIYYREGDLDQLYWPTGELVVTIVNTTNKPYTIIRLVIPTSGLSIYTTNERVLYGKVRAEIEEHLGKFTIKVLTTREPIEESAMPVYISESVQYVMGF